MSYCDSKTMIMYVFVALIIGILIGAGVMFLILQLGIFDSNGQKFDLICQNNKRTIEREFNVEDAYLVSTAFTELGYNCNMDTYGVKYETS